MQNQTKKKLSLIKLYICLFLSIVLEIIEIVFAFSLDASGTSLMMPIWLEWISFVVCVFVICWGGYKFIYYCYEELFKAKMIGMYTMICICILISCCFSFYPLIMNTIAHINHTEHLAIMSFFPTGAIIVSIISFGNYLTEKLQHRAESDLEYIASLKINFATLYNLKTNTTKQVATNDLKVGDYIQIKKGQLIPIDSVLFKGDTFIDESMLTGESRPINKQKNDLLIGGTINVQNTIIAKVSKTLEESTVSQIVENVKNIQAQKPKYRRIVDKIAKWFVPIIICLAIITFLIQAFVPNIQDLFKGLFGNVDLSKIPQAVRALYYAIGVLAVSCPCALGIAVPLASLIGVAKAGKNGIIINHARSYETINKIDTICFDKTGTLTEGKFNVNKIIGPKSNISIIYNMELQSLHPLASSFVKHVENSHLKVQKQAFKVKEIPGIGLKAIYQKNEYKLVSYDYVNKNTKKWKIPKEIVTEINDHAKLLENNLISISFFAKNNNIENMIVFQDQLNENTIDTIKILKERNYKIYMITGDNEKAAKYLANQLGIDYYANTKPHDKAQIVAKLQSQNHKVCYVGDGINDLEVLKQADLSISMNKDNAIVNQVSDINILNKNLLSILKTFFLIKIIHKMIIMNLMWAFIYNIITIPLTMLGYLPAFVAVIAMSMSEIFVFMNAIIFKNKKFLYIKRREIKVIEKQNSSFMI